MSIVIGIIIFRDRSQCCRTRTHQLAIRHPQHHPKIPRRRLKNAMFQAAFVAAQHDPNARAYYQQKRAEGKRHNAAVICVARKRCDIILAMLKTQTPYQPTQHQPLPQAA